MPITLKLVTPVKVLPPQQGLQVTFTASDGEIGVRQGHAALAALVGHGLVELLQDDGSKTTWAVRSGIAQVLENEVNILVDEAVEAAAVDTAAVQARLSAIAGGEAVAAADEPEWLRGQLAAAGRAAPAGRR